MEVLEGMCEGRDGVMVVTVVVVVVVVVIVLMTVQPQISIS